jgi:hypothetical protein
MYNLTIDPHSKIFEFYSINSEDLPKISNSNNNSKENISSYQSDSSSDSSSSSSSCSSSEDEDEHFEKSPRLVEKEKTISSHFNPATRSFGMLESSSNAKPELNTKKRKINWNSDYDKTLLALKEEGWKYELIAEKFNEKHHEFASWCAVRDRLKRLALAQKRKIVVDNSQTSNNLKANNRAQEPDSSNSSDDEQEHLEELQKLVEKQPLLIKILSMVLMELLKVLQKITIHQILITKREK